MTITVANTSNTNTFEYWKNRTNELAHAMTNFVVTTDSNTATGNAGISGTLTANIHFSGNSTVNAFFTSTSYNIANSTSNLSISLPSSTQVSNSHYFLNANGTWVYIADNVVDYSTNSTSGTTTQLIDYYSVSDFSSVEYNIFVSDSSNNYFAGKILTLPKASDVYYTEYASVYSNNSVGTFSANSNTSHIRMYFTPVASSATVKITRITV